MCYLPKVQDFGCLEASSTRLSALCPPLVTLSRSRVSIGACTAYTLHAVALPSLGVDQLLVSRVSALGHFEPIVGGHLCVFDPILYW